MQNIKIKGYAVKKLLLLSIAFISITTSAFLPEYSALRPTWRVTGCDLSYIENKGYLLCANKKETEGIAMTELEANFYYLYRNALKNVSRKRYSDTFEPISCEKINSFNSSEIEALKSMAIDFAGSALEESPDFTGRRHRALAALDLHERILYCQNKKLFEVKTTHGNIIFPDVTVQESCK